MKNFFLFFLFFLFSASFVNSQNIAEIYYSRVCSDCLPYLQKELDPSLKKSGREIILKDYINNPEFRLEMTEKMKEWGVPLSESGHMMTFIEEGKSRIVLAGHVPSSLIETFFTHEIYHLSAGSPGLIIVRQDKMTGKIENYRLWRNGRSQEFPLEETIGSALTKLDYSGTETKKNREFLLPIVLVSGFLDGFHPCAFAVLLFFIAFLYTIGRTGKNIYLMGGLYLLGIYLAYLFIGLGLIKAIIVSDQPYLAGRIGSLLLLILGAVNLIGGLKPDFRIKLEMPKVSGKWVKSTIAKATHPSALIAGFLVGLCSLPCAGGIYVAITALLAAKTTFWVGFLYLIIYNGMFILPLVPVLLLAGSRTVLVKVAEVQKKNERGLKIVLGLGMIALAGIILGIISFK